MFIGEVCDVGCSTGEFLDACGWFKKMRHGMEISAHARRIAESKGIDFSRNITTERDFFDVVVFRGTIQHVPEPFRYIRLAHRALKSGGHIAFLATPNTDSRPPSTRRLRSDPTGGSGSPNRQPREPARPAMSGRRRW